MNLLTAKILLDVSWIRGIPLYNHTLFSMFFFAILWLCLQFREASMLIVHPFT